METITKFKAYNGKEFTDSKLCQAYEARAQRADSIIGRLGSLPNDDGCSFANGGGFLQHSKELVRAVRIDLLKLAKEESDHKWFQQSIDDDSVDPSWAGRIISECCNEQLWKAWHRIMCIDKECREWGQPYYASHPNEGQQIRLTA